VTNAATAAHIDDQETVPTDDSIDVDVVQPHSGGAAALQHDTDYITGVPADVHVGAVEVAPDGSVHVAPDVAAATVDTPVDTPVVTTVDTTELPVEAVAESAAPTDSSITSDDAAVDMIEQSTVTTTTTDPVPDVHDEPAVETPTAPAAAVHASKPTANVNSSGNSSSSSSSNSGNSNSSNNSGNSNTSGSTTGSGGTAGCKLLNDDVVLKFSQEDAPSSNNMLLRRVSCNSAYTNADADVYHDLYELFEHFALHVS
jgi:hypothetical protein